MLHHARIPATLIACIASTMFFTNLDSTAYASQKNTDEVQQPVPGQIRGRVTDTITTTGYTYAEVDTGEKKVWAAAPTTALNIGDNIAFTTEMPMQNFHSKSMQRDFAVLYFVSGFITETASMGDNILRTSSPHEQVRSAADKIIEGVSKLDGGNSIAEIHQSKKQLGGKTIRVRGQVSKITLNVMGKNWLHLRDSSSLDDLTVTSEDAADIGDIIIIEGVVSLDRDFGYGYVYPVIVENASITKE